MVLLVLAKALIWIVKIFSFIRTAIRAAIFSIAYLPLTAVDGSDIGAPEF